MAVTMGIKIRNETAADVGMIAAVTVAAFKALEISGHTEQVIIEALRAAGALALSLVAEVDGRVISHIHPAAQHDPVGRGDGGQSC